MLTFPPPFCRSEVEEDSDLESNSCFCEEPLNIKAVREANIKPRPTVPPRSRAPKRPDKPLYMPRAARQRLSLQNSQGPTVGSELSNPACVNSSSSSSLSDSCTCSETTENTKYLSKQESFLSVADSNTEPSADSSTEPTADNNIQSSADNNTEPSADSSVLCRQEEKQKLVLRLDEDEALVWKQTQSQFADLNVEEENEKDGEEVTSVPHSPQAEDTSTDKDDVTEEVSYHRLNLMVWVYTYSILVLFDVPAALWINPCGNLNVIHVCGSFR